jgi:predicted PurR-regulated permease PerM
MQSGWGERQRLWAATLVLIVLVVLLFTTREAVGPLIVAGLIAYLLNPIVSFVEKRTGFSHRVSVNIVFWLALALIFILPSLYLPSLFREIEALEQDFTSIYDTVVNFILQPLVIGGISIDLSLLFPSLQDVPAISELTVSALHLLETVSVNFLWFLVIMVVIYYLLQDWAVLREWLITLFPENSRKDVRIIYEKIKLVWSGYLRGNLTLMFIVGVVYTVVWAALGLPAALTLGIIIGLLTIIPDVGPAIGAAIATIVALIEGSSYLNIPNLWFAVLILGVYLVLINLKNILIRPRLFGRSVKMHEGLVFVLIIMAVVLQGVLAAIIIIPLAASVSIIGRYFLNALYGQPQFVDNEEQNLKE